uniref:Uncharacterized protein n=1 Tax=Anguilla anguilla TaxID=7936 RepID=A0A0E9W539_ANGAN
MEIVQQLFPAHHKRHDESQGTSKGQVLVGLHGGQSPAKRDLQLHPCRRHDSTPEYIDTRRMARPEDYICEEVKTFRK